MPTVRCESSNCLVRVRPYKVSEETGAQQGGLGLLPLQQRPLHSSGPGGYWQCDCHQCLDQSLISARAQCCSQARPVDYAQALEPSCLCIHVIGSDFCRGKQGANCTDVCRLHCLLGRKQR